MNRLVIDDRAATKPRRILMVSPFPPARDGIADYTADLVAEMRRRGEQVQVVTAGNAAARVPGVLIGLPPRGRFGKSRRLVRSWAPDVVHVQFAVAAFGTRTLSLLKWLRSVDDGSFAKAVTMHEVTRDLASLAAVGRAVYRRLARWADVVIVHTEAAARSLEGLGIEPGKIRRIPHPRLPVPVSTCSAADLRARYRLRNCRILLAFGFLHVDKGLTDLVLALHHLRTTHPEVTSDVRVVIAGGVRRRRRAFRLLEARDHWHALSLRRLMRRLWLNDRVVMTGYVPAGEVAGWFGAAEAVVLPYRRVEQSGVAARAASMGTPLLCSTVGGLAEHPEDVAGQFPPRQPQAMAEVLLRFLTGSELGRPVPRQRRPTDRGMTAVLDATLAAYAEKPARRPGRRLLVLPRDANPYQESLHRELQQLGWRIRYVGQLTPSRTLNLLLLPVELATRRLLGWRLVQLHWVFAFSLPGSAGSRFLRRMSAAAFRLFLLSVVVLRMRLVWTAHNVLPHAPVFPDDVRQRRRLAARADLVVAHSEWTLQALKQIGASPRAELVIDHPAAPLPAPQALPPLEPEVRHLLFFGRVEPYKGVEDLLMVAAALPRSVPLRLTVAGACTDRTYRERLEALATTVALPVDLRLVRVPDHQVDELLCSADAVVLPFRRVTTSGSALLALSRGRPLVLPDLPALAHLPANASLRYPAGVEGLARGLLDFVRLPAEELRRMATAALAGIATTWADAAVRLHECLVAL